MSSAAVKASKNSSIMSTHSVMCVPSSRKKLSLNKQFCSKSGDIFSMRFNLDDSFLALGSSDGSISIIDCQTNSLLHQLSAAPYGTSAPTTSIRWKPQKGETNNYHHLLAVNSDGTITHWDAFTGKVLSKQVENKGHTILALDYNNDGSYFATAGRDHHVRIYDDSTKKMLLDFPEGDWNSPGHSNRIFSLKFLPNEPNVLLSCGWDSNIHIWDMREQCSVGHFHGPRVSGDSLDFKNNQILSGSYRNSDQIQLWDFKTRKLMRNIEWEQGIQQDKAYIYAIQFSKKLDETIVAASSGLNEVRVFDENYNVSGSIKDMSDSIYTVDYCHNSSQFAFGGSERVVYFMNIERK